jgi:hypothetical protein
MGGGVGGGERKRERRRVRVEESRIRQYEFGNRYPRSERDGDGTVFQLDDGLAYHIISNLMDNANKHGGQIIPPWH